MTICINNTKIQTTLILKSTNIEVNLEPKQSPAIKFYHWNLNRLAAHDFGNGTFNRGIHYHAQIRHCMSVSKFF